MRITSVYRQHMRKETRTRTCIKVLEKYSTQQRLRHRPSGKHSTVSGWRLSVLFLGLLNFHIFFFVFMTYLRKKVSENSQSGRSFFHADLSHRSPPLYCRCINKDSSCSRRGLIHRCELDLVLADKSGASCPKGRKLYLLRVTKIQTRASPSGRRVCGQTNCPGNIVRTGSRPKARSSLGLPDLQ
ncbi:hypothetical protein RRG08_031900 [Elysia crispata]|uniref:Uncharacterized protein n=1 Tax=Elysia crispata TaxID=231223 RepID=A0AAE1AH02_9GAST|nr:hypothetical protein RRG08_031900 [Elysia crispata]